MQRNDSKKLLLYYYDATLVFIALDLLLDVNVRLSFLETLPGWRAAYYAFCLACAALMHRRPDFRLAVGAVEGLVTMIGLIISTYFGYTFADVRSTGELAQAVLNYGISGFFAHLSWSRGMAALSSTSADA